MKDKALGEKRLASMPDRITNTIRVKDGGVVNRPTVINCFGGDMHTVALWWAAWKQFMFHSSIILPNKSGAGVKTVPAAMLSKIKRSKYPAITEEEERISIPLQTLAQAIFDAILVHIVNSVSANAKWQTLQQQMCDALNRYDAYSSYNIWQTCFVSRMHLPHHEDCHLSRFDRVRARFFHAIVSFTVDARMNVLYPFSHELIKTQT